MNVVMIKSRTMNVRESNSVVSIVKKFWHLVRRGEMEALRFVMKINLGGKNDGGWLKKMMVGYG